MPKGVIVEAKMIGGFRQSLGAIAFLKELLPQRESTDAVEAMQAATKPTFVADARSQA